MIRMLAINKRCRVPFQEMGRVPLLWRSQFVYFSRVKSHQNNSAQNFKQNRDFTLSDMFPMTFLLLVPKRFFSVVWIQLLGRLRFFIC